MSTSHASSSRAAPGGRAEPPSGGLAAANQAAVTAPASDGPLGLVVALCDALAAEQVRYCHWKSTESIGRSERADSDLDLLIGRGDARAFEAILDRLGFKRGRQSRGRQIPGLFHAFGLDDASGKLVHVHAHYELVLGDDTTKNYRLPIEDGYLASASRAGVFSLPAPEFEYVVFVLRMMLKHATWDAVTTGKGSLSAGERREHAHLTERADRPRARAVVRDHLAFIPPQLWDDCVRLVAEPAMSPARIRAARRLERALAPYARRSPTADPFVRVSRRAGTAIARRVRRRPRRRSRLDRGGAIVAVVGGDGAGKSTVVAELVRWLGRDLDVVAVHLGKPRRSALSGVVDLVWRRATPTTRDRGPSPLSDEEPMTPRRLVKLVRKVMISRDRYLEYRRARRSAAAGVLIVSDRFPIPNITRMDAPATASIPRARASSAAVRVLARIERRYYARIGRPDVLVVLRVDPGVAVRRRLGIEREEMVRERAEEIWRLRWDELPAVVIDGERPRADVLREAKAAIWERI